MKFTTRLAVALAAAFSVVAPASAQTVLRSQTISYDNIAALEAVPFARFQAGAAVIIIDGGRAGTFIKVTTDQSALTTADPQECVFIASPQDTDGSSGGWMRAEWMTRADVVNVEWCGANADGTSEDSAGDDDYTAFNAAQALARTVEVPEGYYNLGTTLKLSSVGHTLRGLVENGSILVISHQSGCGVTVTSRRSTVENLVIVATDARRGTLGDGKEADGDHGICVQDPTLAPGGTIASKTQVKILNNQIWRHPGDGIHFIGAGSDSEINGNNISFNRRHGVFVDDGTDAGFTTKSRAGIITLAHNVVTENGGHGMVFGLAGFTVYRPLLINNELFGNVWNSGVLSIANAEMYLRTQNAVLLSGAVGDPFASNTTMTNGDDRTSKSGSESDGIEISASSTETTIINKRYIDVTIPIDDKGSTGLTVDMMEIAPATSYAVYLGSTSSGVDIKLADSGGYLTEPVNHTSTDVVGGHLTVGNIKYLLTGSSGKFALDYSPASPAQTTISSNAVNINSSLVSLQGQGDAADDLQAINFSGGTYQIPDGVIFTMINEEAYNITIKDGLTNVETWNGADIVLGPGEAVIAVARNQKVYILSNS